MKVKSVTITGMHKVDRKTYVLNDDVTYFIGENGAGKSTILEAIQLGLLGYIPGYAKTNESIMKHASGHTMSVELELDEGIHVARTWMRSGASVKSNVDITGYNGDLAELYGKVDLPVFDFNEFKSMTANKLKDWFITFLPASEDGVDILEELKNAMKNRAIPCEDLLSEVDEWIKACNIESPLETVRELNKKFKEDQSFVKGQIANLEGTLKSLIKYDDEDELDDAAVAEELSDLEVLKNKRMQYDIALSNYEKALESLEALKKALPAADFQSDPRAAELISKVQDLMKRNQVLEADYRDLKFQIDELQRAKSQLTRSADTCPYTNQFCQTAADLATKTREQAAEFDKQISFKQEEMKECSPELISENNRKIMQLNAEYGAMQSEYDRLVAMQLRVDGSAPEGECPSDKTVEELNNSILALQNKLVKIRANQKYEELSSKVRADKFRLDNELEVYKVWTKLTDANGLQTTLMNKPFELLASEMSDYLSKMFNKPTTAEFNLVSKANSFSFGLTRDDQYIEFDYLSSGERCLFTLALIVCILDKSQSRVRTVLVDDILDHLDSDNASSLFSALRSINSVQFILAGVKECSDASICKQV